MKITLDLTALVAKGQLTQQESDRLQLLAAQDTGTMGSNILLAFGMIAVAAGASVFVPTAQTAIVVGAVMIALGLYPIFQRMTRWLVFAQIAVVIGGLALEAGIWVVTGSSWQVALALAAGLAVLSVLASSGVLAALAVLLLAAALGNSTLYAHATYFFGVDQPALTIGVLSALTLVLFLASLRLPHAYERLAIIAARTAILLINLAFLVGSIFGDTQLNWPAAVFRIGWAVVLFGALIWAVTVNRRWLVNAVAVFGAIHFYTQWFETLGASPLSVIGGGVLLIVFGLALARFNQWIATRRQTQAKAA